MKKILLYILLLTAVVVIPQQGTDVGKLLPVELVWLDRVEDQVLVSTDVGAGGIGPTVKDAIENMKETTAGEIFLDTADFLLVTERGQEELASIKELLKPSVRVCVANSEMDLKDAASYLAVHKPLVRLRQCSSLKELPILAEENGKIILKENEKT